MRIVICWQGMSGYMGACWRELSALPGIELKVFTPELSSQYAYKDEVMNGVDWTQLTPEQLTGPEALKSLFDEFEPHVVVLSGWVHKSFRGLPRLNWDKSPVFLLCMDTPWRGDFRQFLAPLALYLYLRRLSGIVVPGRRGQSYARWLGFSAGQIQHGLYGYDGSGLETAYLSRLEEWPRSFLFVGRYVEVKAIDILVEAYQRYRSLSKAPWDLICCGKGPLGGLLASCDGIVDKGFVPPGELASVLAQSGCFVFPSTYEPWGVALAEACGSGLPVICSRAVGASDELVRDGENGFLVEPGNAADLAQRMIDMEHRVDDFAGMGQISRKLAAPFEARAWARAWQDNLKKLTENRTYKL